jgi:hypothetical protein
MALSVRHLFNCDPYGAACKEHQQYRNRYGYDLAHPSLIPDGFAGGEKLKDVRIAIRGDCKIRNPIDYSERDAAGFCGEILGAADDD